MKIQVKGIKETIRAIEKERDRAIELSRQAAEASTMLVELEAKKRLIDKDLDPEKKIERSMGREIKEEGETVIGEVFARADEAYHAEVGAEGGFLFISVEMNKARILDSYVYTFADRYK